jgi:transcriptional regulator with XRE-family HTH domain
MDKTALGARLREIRDSLEMTRETIAGTSGISKKAIEKVENGENTSLDTLAAITEAMGVRVAPLIEVAEASAQSPKPLPDFLTFAKLLQGVVELSPPQKCFVAALCLNDETYISTRPELAPLLPLLKKLLKLR